MKKITPNLILLLLTFFLSIKDYAQNVMTSSNNFTQLGWEEEQINKYVSGTVRQLSTPYVEIVCGPQDFANLHPGSVLMTLPKSQDPTLRRIRLRNNKYGGIYLKKIAAKGSFPGCLQYNTFITQNKNFSAQDLVLEIDADDNGTIDYNLAFSPTLQQNLYANRGGFPFSVVKTLEWQTWNAAAGWWVVGIGEALPAGLDPNFRLAEFLQHFPFARLRNSTSGNNAGGGIRFTIGGDSPDYDDFIGYLDGFMIFRKSNRMTNLTWIDKDDQLRPITYDFIKTNPPCQLINESITDSHR